LTCVSSDWVSEEVGHDCENWTFSQACFCSLHELIEHILELIEVMAFFGNIVSHHSSHQHLFTDIFIHQCFFHQHLPASPTMTTTIISVPFNFLIATGPPGRGL